MLFSSSSFFSDNIIIHIHGNFGNFYQNKFLWIMSHIYIENNIDFLTINLSSHDGLSEGYYGRELKYVGGAVTDYNCSQDDIDAAISFVLSKGYKKVILQGHSLGCDKVIQYVIENHCKFPFILLSPVDSYKVQSNWIKPEKIENQILRLKSKAKKTNENWGMADFDWLEANEYGANGNTSEWTYQIPITNKALVSILSGSAFKYLNLDYGTDFLINNPVYAFVGKRDALQMHNYNDWINFLKKSFSSIEISSDLEADHDVVGVEEELCNRIVRWINKL